MKLLAICSNICYPYIEMSGNKAIFDLFKNLAMEHNVNVHIVSHVTEDGEPIANSKNLTFHYTNTRSLQKFRLVAYEKALELKKEKFDIVHDFSSLPLLVGFTGLLGKILGAKSVHSLVTIIETPLGSSKFLWGKWLVDKLILTDRDSYSKVNFEKAVNLPLGLDFSNFENSFKPELPEEVIFLGSLEGRKGVDVFVLAAKRLLNMELKLKFKIFTYGEELRDVKFTNNFNRVTNLIGNSEIEITQGFFDASKIFGPKSIYIQANIAKHGTFGIPLTALEAMRSGSPCVLSDVYDGEEFADYCLTYSANSSKGLAKAIEIVSKKFSRKTISASNFVYKKFSVETTAKDIMNLYEGLK